MKRVFFIGSGYECAFAIYVEATTPMEAMEKAEKLYQDNGWNFEYCELEVDRYEW
jgi:hypothetical protein